MNKRRAVRVPKVDEFGIADSYLNASNQWRKPPASTLETIRRRISSDECATHNGHGPHKGPIAIFRGGQPHIASQFDLFLEDGAELRSLRRLPPDIPFGYHKLREHDGAEHLLVMAPGECYLPKDLKIWGWAIQLYALRSRSSWGMGDLADLRRLNRWAKKLGAGISIISPLGADTPGRSAHPSPYSPSSRCFRNLLYLAIENIAGINSNDLEFKKTIVAGRKLNQTSTIDRDAILRLKFHALERIWAQFTGDSEFNAFQRELGELLQTFSTFCVLAEHFGQDWQKWPAKYRQPDSPAVQKFAAENKNRRQFFAWIQWLLDQQLMAASREVRLMQDLPIGVDPGGADAWMWQDVFAKGVSAGAPPDLYNQAGQNWGLSTFVPHKLCAAGYAPFVQTVRAMLRYAGGLRIDHVMGLFRLFWIPDGVAPSDGAYIHYPIDDLLAILALESHRAKAIVVGEDLGTVDPAIQRKLMEHQLLSYRLMWFEEDPPKKFPRNALAAVSTHDLPTVAGLWTGQDERDEAKAGLKSNTEGWQMMRRRLGRQLKSSPNTPVNEVIRKTYKSLAQAPSVLVTASLEDAVAVPHRPNMPSTVDTWPNWSIPLPGGLERVKRSKLAKSIADAMQLRGRKSAKPRGRASRTRSGIKSRDMR